MSMPVKLSDALVLDARLAGQVMERSIAGQVEFWARLGRAIDPVLDGARAMAVSRRGAAIPVAQAVADVADEVGRQRLSQYLGTAPFPHYEAHPERAGMLVRIEADGTRMVGRFVQRVFVPVTDA